MVGQSETSTAARVIRVGSRALHPSLVAVLTYLVCLPLAFGGVSVLVSADPFDLRVAMIPAAVAVVGVVVLGVAAWRWPADLVSAVAAGVLAGWVAFTLRLALHGTPYGFDGLGADAGRMAAMANRYSTALNSSDGIVSTVPSQYPPLFPWLVGRAAALAGVPAWRLLGPAEAIALSFAVVAGFALWRLLVPGPLALALTLPVLLASRLDPAKAYEILVLSVLVPWVIATFGRPPDGRRLHWLPSGLIGGLAVTMYWAFILFGLLGIAALVVVTWREEPQRARYLRHVVLVVVVAAAVAAWYWVPYVGWSLLHGSRQVADVWPPGVQDSPLTFLAMTPLAVLELVGVAGLLWWRGRVWWGRPLLLLTGSVYAYWLIWLGVFIMTGHTGLLQYTPWVAEPLLAMAGVLTLTTAGQGVARRLGDGAISVGRAVIPDATPRALSVVALCVLVLWAAFTAWPQWMPGGADATTVVPLSASPNPATYAFLTPLPDGRYPGFGPVKLRWQWFPVDPVERDVESVLGPHASPVTLSDQAGLFVYVSWPGYIDVNEGAAGAETNWPARFAALRRLSRITDPAAFAAASARTSFGPIDVFILNASAGRWIWQPNIPTTLSFSPAQFSSGAFTIFTGLRGNTVVAVRKPSRQG